jgi:hypothetical protein
MVAQNNIKDKLYYIKGSLLHQSGKYQIGKCNN